MVIELYIAGAASYAFMLKSAEVYYNNNRQENDQIKLSPLTHSLLVFAWPLALPISCVGFTIYDVIIASKKPVGNKCKVDENCFPQERTTYLSYKN